MSQLLAASASLSFSHTAIIVLVLGAAFILLDVSRSGSRPLTTTLSGIPFALIATVLGITAPAGSGLATAALGIILLIALLLLPTMEFEDPSHAPEAGALLLLSTTGAIALTTAVDLLQAIVGLETLALAAVTLVALGQGYRPLEAAFKYFVLGAVGLAILLYGAGLVYLGTGSFQFPTASQLGSNHLVLAGAAFLAVGFAFELALFPFHWGALDAYTAATPALAGFVMSASKIGAAFALGRLAFVGGASVGQILVWLGVFTIAWGTFGALAQRDTRRLLAYSAITHAGFIGLAAGSGPGGLATAGFYAAMYGLMAMLFFAAIAGRDPNELSQGRLSGLGPLRAGAVLLALLSLSGIPPTPGFWAKLAVLVVAWQSAGPIPALIAAAGGVFSVLYYLRPVPDLIAEILSSTPGAVRSVRPASLPGILLAGILVIAVSLFPALVWNLAGVVAFGS